MKLKLGKNKKDKAEPKKAKGKAKAKLSVDDIKGMLLAHVEKIVLGAALLTAALFVLFGFGHKRLGQSMSPESLVTAANTATAHIQRATWPEQQSLRDFDGDYEVRATESIERYLPLAYELRTPLNPPTIKPQVKRSDPKLLTITELEVYSGHGALAQAPEGKKGRASGRTSGGGAPRPRSVARQRMRKAGMGDVGRSKKGSSNIGRREEKRTRDDSNSPEGGLSDSLRTLNERQASQLEGIRPNPTEAKAQSVRFVAITGIYHARKLMEEYERCFQDAVRYDPEQDFPVPLGYKVQRAEITGDGAKPKWKDLDTTTLSRTKRINRWYDETPEVADPAYLSEFDLAHQLPPIMMRDLTDLGRHTKVPAFNPNGASDIEEPDEFEGEANLLESTIDSSAASKKKMDYELFRFFDFKVEPGRVYQYRVKLVFADPNSPAVLNSGTPRIHEADLEPEVVARIKQSIGQRLVEAKKELASSRSWLRRKSKNGAIHFYKRAARYEAVFPPDGDSLSKLRKDLLNEGIDSRKLRHPPLKPPEIESPWSGPSPPIRVLSDNNVLAGSVRPSRNDGEMKAQIVAHHWNHADSFDVGFEKTVLRGAIVNFRQRVAAVDPITLEFKKAETYTFQTNTMVADFRRVRWLPGKKGSKNERLTAPGEMLLINAHGDLVIRNELDDMNIYKSFLFNYQKPPDVSNSSDDDFGAGK